MLVSLPILQRRWTICRMGRLCTFSNGETQPHSTWHLHHLPCCTAGYGESHREVLMEGDKIWGMFNTYTLHNTGYHCFITSNIIAVNLILHIHHLAILCHIYSILLGGGSGGTNNQWLLNQASWPPYRESMTSFLDRVGLLWLRDLRHSCVHSPSIFWGLQFI